MTDLDHKSTEVFLSKWFADPDVSEVLLDARYLWIVRRATRERCHTPFRDPAALQQLMVSVARASGVRLDPMVGAAGGSFDDGAYRWHCLLPPMARDGPLVSIRRHRFASLELDDFVLPDDARRGLLANLATGVNLIVAGATGSGKSSLLAALLKRLPDEERIFLIESVPELAAVSKGLVRLSPREANLEQLGAFSLERLLRESLRLLPDRIVIGEVRGTEVPVLVDAMRVGHNGILTTMHAASADDVIRRIAGRLPESEQNWHQYLSAPLVVLFMERGNPPLVRAIQRIDGETLEGSEVRGCLP